MFKAAVLLSQQYNITIDGQFIEWQSVETNGNVIDVLSKACQALSISNSVGIPVISYSVTDPDLSDRNVYTNFYRIAPSDNLAALAIIRLFIRFNWTSFVLIYQNDEFGSRGAKIINEVFNNNNLTVECLIIFEIVTFRIRGDLRTHLMNSATRIVILWVQTNYIALILRDALESDALSSLFTWILNLIVSLNTFDKKYHAKLIGLFAIEPVTENTDNVGINTTLLKQAYHIWQQYESESFPGQTKVNYYALFAI
ncbi:unnamed protein product [Rotaria sp. Silwood1]|nr:unnamed protein product [Rotaria sp. Silwood1]